MIDFFSDPWLMSAPALASFAERCEAISFSPEPNDDAPVPRDYLVRDGVAELRVTGTILPRSSMWLDFAGIEYTGLDRLAEQLDSALADDGVRAIVFSYDSPGGKSTGVPEMADRIQSASEQKPVVSYVSGQACSAAYWLASAASQIVTAKVATLGSIGAVQIARRPSPKDPIEFVSSQSPKKRLSPETDDGAAELQAIADDMAAVFINAVAENRGYSPEKVMSDFGQGGVKVGQKAVDCGMADRIGSCESVMAAMAKKTLDLEPFTLSAGDPGEPTPAEKKPMGFYEKVVGWFAKNEPDRLEAALEGVASDGGEVRVAATATLKPAAETETAKAQLDEIKGLREALAVADAAAFDVFFDSHVRANRALPAEREGAKAAYLSLADSDRRSGASDLAAWKASFDARPSHKLTTEQVVADAGKLPAGTAALDSAAPTPEELASVESKRRVALMLAAHGINAE